VKIVAPNQTSSQLPAMPRKSQPPPPQATTWIVYKIASKQTWLGFVEAANEREAVEKAEKEFKVDARRLIALRRA